jgi:hypothetical protein
MMDAEGTMSEDGEMMVAFEVGVSLVGGTVLLQIGDSAATKKLSDMAIELIESRELADFTIPMDDLKAIDEVRRELEVTADLIGQRVELERDRARARGM